MSDKKERSKGRKIAGIDLNSKFWRTFLRLSAGFLMFAGPTYVVYILLNVVELSIFVSLISGFVLFVAGLILTVYLVKKGIIS